MAKQVFTLLDLRCQDPACYPSLAKYDRRGQMKRSWHLGVAQRTDGSECVTFEDGLTWGSIGQLFGYLLGDTDEAFQDDLYEKLERAFRGTDRWVGRGNPRE
jgi:hypothetical protein